MSAPAADLNEARQAVIDRQVDRILAMLHAKIREQGFTQLEVQDRLGWGRSYISQLVNRQKSLRVDQIIAILRVIGVGEAGFFAEIFQRPFPPATATGSVPALEHEVFQLQKRVGRMELALRRLTQTLGSVE